MSTMSTESPQPRGGGQTFASATAAAAAAAVTNLKPAATATRVDDEAEEARGNHLSTIGDNSGHLCQRCQLPRGPPVQFNSIGCQTEPNLIDKLIDTHQRKQLDDVDLYQEYVRSAECAQFWPLDKNPIRSLVPAMLKIDLPEQHLKNESLMFDLVQAITNSSKLVNLLAKYIHHIVPNVIISKRIDLIPLITCTIRVCHDSLEQERLISLLFNLIKRPNEEQRRMILSGIIVVLQVSPHQSAALLLPNLWDHVEDKFPERRILLAESCSTLAHYVRPIMRTNLILSILIQLLKDKHAAVRSSACKSFACLLSLIMDRNDEVFDACLSATEDIIQDMLQQTPVSLCEHRFELEQMRFCILETIFPLVTMWAVKLNRFKLEVAEFFLAKAEKYFLHLASQRAINAYLKMLNYLVPFVFSDAVHSCAWLTKSKLHLPDANHQHHYNHQQQQQQQQQQSSFISSSSASSTSSAGFEGAPAASGNGFSAGQTPPSFVNKLLEPTLIVDESAIVAFHDQLEQEHIQIDSVDWILNKFLVKFLDVLAHFAHNKFYITPAGSQIEIVHEYLFTIIASIRQLCLLFGKHLTRTKLRPLIKQYVTDNNCHSLCFLYITSLTSFEPIEQQEFEEIVLVIRQSLLLNQLTRNDVEVLAVAIKIMATSSEQIRSPSTRQKFLTYILDALVNYSNQIIRTSSSSSSSLSSSQNGTTNSTIQTIKNPAAALNKLTRSSSVASGKAARAAAAAKDNQANNQTQAKEFMLIIFRHILTCLIDPNVRPTEWAHILVTKFLPLLILLANDSADVYVCTYARLMCAQLVDTFDNHLSCPKLTEQMASQIMPALNSLKGLTEQIRASNLKRQIESLTVDMNERFFKKPQQPQQQHLDTNNNETGGGKTLATSLESSPSRGS